MSNDRKPFDNPFATRYTRPGSIGYHFPSGLSADRLVEKLRANRWSGQIVGPHGAGKSTLLATLLPVLEEAGREVYSLALRDSQRRLPRTEIADWHWGDKTLIVIDGYEQLSRLSRWKLKRRCRRAAAGLLVTSHTEVGLPNLISVQTDRKVVKRLIHDLDSETIGHALSESEWDELFDKHHDNVRELLFDLYNRYERRKR